VASKGSTVLEPCRCPCPSLQGPGGGRCLPDVLRLLANLTCRAQVDCRLPWACPNCQVRGMSRLFDGPAAQHVWSCAAAVQRRCDNGASWHGIVKACWYMKGLARMWRQLLVCNSTLQLHRLEGGVSSTLSAGASYHCGVCELERQLSSCIY
jgi:hypothetical protein